MSNFMQNISCQNLETYGDFFMADVKFLRTSNYNWPKRTRLQTTEYVRGKKRLTGGKFQ